MHQGAKKSTTTSLFCAIAAWKASGEETDIRFFGSAPFHLQNIRSSVSDVVSNTLYAGGSTSLRVVP